MRADGSVQEVSADALCITIGAEPHHNWLPSEIARDGGGYVLTARDILQHAGAHWNAGGDPLLLETSMPGVFAARDVQLGVP